MHAQTTGKANTLSDVFDRAQQDEAFRNRLLAEPRAVLEAANVNLPPQTELRTIDATPGTSYLVLPPAPSEGEVSDDDLRKASGGTVTVAVLVTVGLTIAWGVLTYGLTSDS